MREISIAPIGAVTTMDKMHTVRMVSAYVFSSGVKVPLSRNRLNMTGPKAACTVAFAIQAKEQNICENEKKIKINRNALRNVG